MNLVFFLVLLFHVLFFGGASDSPNIILIVTDDQDVVLKGMLPMSNVLKDIANKGATFTNAFTSSPLCCPSRSSILSGQFPHNHATINNSELGGCYGSFWKEHVEQRTIASVLSSRNYNTFYAGKYLNEYKGDQVPFGWSEFYGLVGNSRYYNYTLNENGVLKNYGNTYLTDLIRYKAGNFLKEETNPFFMVLAPPAPHAPFTPAPRHSGDFPDVKADRTPNFNLKSSILDKHWLLTMKPEVLPDDVIDEIDDIARKRWQSLLAVDDMVGSIVDILEERDLMDNTFLIFTSDNGYHLGQFAQAYDKRQPYETDIRIPLVVRGPGVGQKVIVNKPTLLVDLFPTIMEIAGLKVFSYLDGKSFLPDLKTAPAVIDFHDLDKSYNRYMLVEHWGEYEKRKGKDECGFSGSEKLNLCTKDAACHCQDSWNNTYSCLRHMNAYNDILYCEFRDHEQFVEIYDLQKDPYEIENLNIQMLPSLQADYSLKLQDLSLCLGDQCKQYDII